VPFDRSIASYRPMRGCGRVVTVLSASAVVAIAAAPAQAVAAPAGCSASAGTVSCAFAYTGDEQRFTVPDGVRRLHVELVGGRGFSPNAYGGTVAAELTVTPGQVLFVEVGGQGGAPGPSPSLGGTGGDAGGTATGGTGGDGGAASAKGGSATAGSVRVQTVP
jgi:hypothetical protein